MRPEEFIVVLYLILPVLLVGAVWWFWTRRRPQGRAWRKTATFTSVTAATASSALLMGLVGWANLASVAPSQGHRNLFFTLALLGFALCIAAIPATVVGLGAFRWLVIPAALLQGFSWFLLLHIATMPIFPG